MEVRFKLFVIEGYHQALDIAFRHYDTLENSRARLVMLDVWLYLLQHDLKEFLKG